MQVIRYICVVSWGDLIEVYKIMRGIDEVDSQVFSQGGSVNYKGTQVQGERGKL